MLINDWLPKEAPKKKDSSIHKFKINTSIKQSLSAISHTFRLRNIYYWPKKPSRLEDIQKFQVRDHASLYVWSATSFAFALETHNASLSAKKCGYSNLYIYLYFLCVWISCRQSDTSFFDFHVQNVVLQQIFFLLLVEHNVFFYLFISQIDFDNRRVRTH